MLFCSGLIARQELQFEKSLTEYFNFSFDTLLFGKVPSIFIMKQGYSEEESFKILTENLKKNKENIFYLIEDLNLLLKIESLNFELRKVEIIKKLKDLYKNESNFIFEYVGFFESVFSRDKKSVINSFSVLCEVKDLDFEQEMIVGLLKNYFKGDRAFLEKVLLKVTKKMTSKVFTNYLCGKIAMYILDNEELAIVFWKAVLVDAKGKLRERLPSILIKNIEKYRKLKQKSKKSIILEKFYLELRLWNDPGNPIWLNNLGYFLGEIGRYKKAIEYCRNAVKARPTDPYFLDSLGWVLYKSGNSEEGSKYLKKAIQYKADFYEALYHLSTIYYAEKDYDKAAELLKKAIKADEKKSVAKNDLGYILIDTDKDYAAGIKYVKAALEIDPNNPFYLDSLGWGYHKIGKYGAAAGYLWKSYIKRPLFDNMIHLSSALIALGIFDKARKLLSENYKRWPRSEQLIEYLGIIDLLIHLESKIKNAEDKKKRNYYQLLLGNLYAGLKLPFHAYAKLKNVFPIFRENHSLARLKKILGIKIIQRYYKGLGEYPIIHMGKIPVFTAFYLYCGIFEKELFKLLNFDYLIKNPSAKKNNKQPVSFIDLYKYSDSKLNEFVVSWKLPSKRITGLLMSLLASSKYLKTIIFGEKFEIDIFGLTKLKLFPAIGSLVVGSISADFERIYSTNYVVSGIIENIGNFNKKYLMDIPTNWFRKLYDNPYVKELNSVKLIGFNKIEKSPKVSIKLEFSFNQNKINKKEYIEKIKIKIGKIKKVFSQEVEFFSYFKEGKNSRGITVNTHNLDLKVNPVRISPQDIKQFIIDEKAFEKFIFKMRNYFK